MANAPAWRRRFQRLGSMSRSELVDRIRQHASARLDAYRQRRGHDFAAEFECQVSGKTGRFFFAPAEVSGICEVLKQRLPSSAAAIVTSAERICRHRFDLLGYEDLQYGTEIDWHLDLVHEKRGPRKPWFQIRYLDFDEVGDSKITWELNRHQHFVTLAKAYRLTGDERFVRELVAQWKSWHDANPYPIGMNWASSLEVAFRSLSWMWTYFLLADTPGMTPELRREFMRALGVSGRHIETYLSTYFSPNTHLLGEAVALFFLGTLFPDFPEAARWKKRGWQVVVESIRKQVRADGFYFEQSAYYHVYALDFFLHARVMASLNAVNIPADYDVALIKMLDALCLLGRAGLVPSIGDDDGGRLFDPRRNRAEYLLDPLSTGAVLFERGDFKFVCGACREETLWLLGIAGFAAFEQLQSEPPSDKSVALRESGLFLMADADIGQQCLVDAGPQGPASAGHGHADALSVHLTGNGSALLMDPGTMEYVGESQNDRAYYRGTAAHNTMRVDALDQADGTGPFSWTNLPAVKAECWIAGQKFNFFAGSHDGYARLAQPVTHRRWVFHRKAHFWLVRDAAEGHGTHSLEISWHLGSNFSPASARDYLFGNGTETLGVVTAEGHGWSQSGQRCYWSPVYGRKERATVLTFGTTAELPAEFVSLLLPNASVHVGVGHLQRISGDPAVSAYRYLKDGEEHYFFFANTIKAWSVAGWASDAQFLYWGVNRAQGEQVLVLCRGSYAEAVGLRVLAGSRLVDYAEVVGSAGKTELFSSAPDWMQLQGSLERVESELDSFARDTRRIGV